MGEISITEQAARNLAIYANHHAVLYLGPLHKAMAAGTVAAHLVFRDTVGVQLSGDRPDIVIFFDAGEGSTGPSKFHQGLLADVVRLAKAVIVIASYGDPKPYADAVATAIKSGGPILLAETTEAHVGEWLALANEGGEGRVWGLWASPVMGSA